MNRALTIFQICENTEQRVCIIFSFKIRNKAYADESMGRSQVFEWFNRFKSGRVSCESDARSGRPTTSCNDDMEARVRTVIRNNRRMTVREVAEECGISIGSCETILTCDLKMGCVTSMFVPRLLTEDQQEQRMFTASDLFQRASEDDEVMKNIITGDD